MATVKELNKKSRIRFNTENDLDLLRLVLGENPFEDSSKWINIQNTIIDKSNKQFSLRTLKEHVEYLLKLFLKEDRANLKRSGTEEEYQEKERLLQEINDLKREYLIDSEDNSNNMSRQRDKGVEIRNNALKNCPKEVIYIVQDDGSLTKEVTVDKEVQQNQQGNETDLISSDFSSNTPSTVLGPTHARSMRMNKCSNPTLQYLKKKSAIEHEFKEKQLHLEEKKLILEECRIVLQEQMFQLQREEMMMRIEAESKERAAHLKILEQQQQMISLFLQYLPQKNT